MLKKWVDSHLISNEKLVSKRITQQWFIKNGFDGIYNQIVEKTNFLSEDVKFSQRLWHIVNENYKRFICRNPNCSNETSFIHFKSGYLETCSSHCAQKNPHTIEKIIKTNRKRLGVDYPQQSSVIKKKSILSVQNKYGVDNISQANTIKKKKEKTCLKNYGVRTPLDQEYRKRSVIKKYGVDNVMKLSNVSQKVSITRKEKFYHNLFSSDRLKQLVEPLFSIDEYNGSPNKKLKYKFRCIACRNIFYDHLKNGKIPRCFDCYPIDRRSSVGERELVDFVKSLYKNEIVLNDRSVLRSQELDIYLPKEKLAIEYNGLYWHSELNGKDKNYHLNKTIECEKQGIRLIHIFEDEWLFRREIVERRLKYILGISEKSVYARNCEIREISAEDKNNFLETYHIQGMDKSAIKLGAFYQEELIGVMTFGLQRISLGSQKEKGTYELIRFATKYSSPGLASKFLSYFIKNYRSKLIVSYSDRRWNMGSLYETLGFQLISDGFPNYWYIDSGQRFHRFNFRKNVLDEKLEEFNSDLTEWQNMQLNGYDRIWDCGSKKYELLI